MTIATPAPVKIAIRNPPDIHIHFIKILSSIKYDVNESLGLFSGCFLIFQTFQLADRDFIGNPLLVLRLRQFLNIFPALNPPDDLDMLANFKS